MHRTKRLLIGFAALVGMAAPALAQPAQGWQSPPGPGAPPNYHHQAPPPGYPPQGHPPQGYPPQGHPPPGYPPAGYRWHRGERFYGPPPVVIHNYGYYRLAPPPRGYYWVRSGDQFLMVAIASGIIVSIILAPVH